MSNYLRNRGFIQPHFFHGKSGAGFTLIEILIVVAIIAILSSVVLVGLGPTRRLGRDSRRISDINEVQQGLELYNNKCGYYPGTAQVSSPCGSFSSISTWANLTAALTGSNLDISNVPNDPTAGSTYFYGTAPGGTRYVLGAQLEDTSNPALRQSVDVTTFGVACSRANGLYCVQL